MAGRAVQGTSGGGVVRTHGELKIMRSGFVGGVWWAVREKDGIVQDRWPLDANSIRQLEEMRAAFIESTTPDPGK